MGSDCRLTIRGYLTIGEETMIGSGDRFLVMEGGGGSLREERTRTGGGTRSRESMSIDVAVRVGSSATRVFVSRCIDAHRKHAMIHS